VKKGGEKKREKQRKKKALRVSRELVEYRAWLSGKEYGWFYRNSLNDALLNCERSSNIDLIFV